MPSDPPEIQDWDAVDYWGRRILRWFAIGFPVWLIFLAAFNQDLTGIPWVVGLVIASVLATTGVVVADRRFTKRDGQGSVGPFARVLGVWVIVFFVLALVVGSGDANGAAVFLIPFAIATIVAGGVELARRVLGRQ